MSTCSQHITAVHCPTVHQFLNNTSVAEQVFFRACGSAKDPEDLLRIVVQYSPDITEMQAGLLAVVSWCRMYPNPEVEVVAWRMCKPGTPPLHTLTEAAQELISDTYNIVARPRDGFPAG